MFEAYNKKEKRYWPAIVAWVVGVILFTPFVAFLILIFLYINDWL